MRKRKRHIPVKRFRQIQIFVLAFLLFSSSIFGAATLDPNFGVGGKMNFRYGVGSLDVPAAVAQQSDGKIIIVGGTALNGDNVWGYDFSVARLNADGSLDGTFGTNGKSVTQFTQFNDFALSVVVQPDGKIVAAGYSESKFALARYNSNGSLDDTFGTGGKVVVDFPEGSRENIYYLLPQADGKFIAVGIINEPGKENIALARFNTDGSLDTSFGTNGRYVVRLGLNYTYLSGAAIQPDGKFLLSGSFVYPLPNCLPSPKGCIPQSDTQAFLLRFDQQLRLDKKFGRRMGREFTGRGGENSLTNLSLQADGSILGTTGLSSRRYTANGRLETVFEQPVFTGQNPNQSYIAQNLKQRSNGSIVGCNSVSGTPTSDIGVTLFNGSGRVAVTQRLDFFGFNDVCDRVFIQQDNKILLIGRAETASGSGYSTAVIRLLDITP